MAQACIGLMMLCQFANGDPAPADAPDPPAIEQVAPEDEASPPEVSNGWPIEGALGQLIFCIEGYESQHGTNMYNRSSGAAGWLQWLPGTARRWSVQVGNRQSEWDAAARIAAVGRAFMVSQWVPLQRGLC